MKGAFDMGLFNKLLKIVNPLEKWIDSASDEELADGYEERRQTWLKVGGGEKTTEMLRIDREMSKHSAEKWKKDPRRNTDPNYRWTDSNRWDKD